MRREQSSVLLGSAPAVGRPWTPMVVLHETRSRRALTAIISGRPIALPFRGPPDRVEEEPRERGAGEQFLLVTELEIQVAALVVRVRPDDGVIAHLHGAGRVVAVLIHGGQHADVGPRRPVVG